MQITHAVFIYLSLTCSCQEGKHQRSTFTDSEKEEGPTKTGTVKTYECGYRDITDSRSPPAWKRLPTFIKEDHPLLIMVTNPPPCICIFTNKYTRAYNTLKGPKYICL